MLEKKIGTAAWSALVLPGPEQTGQEAHIVETCGNVGHAAIYLAKAFPHKRLHPAIGDWECYPRVCSYGLAKRLAF